ncbi:MAG: PhoH family protein [Deltaproteobacteria bacterium]|nr:MAG: PhoH family protein [Deltaproteobacteria bacterium]
MTFDDNQLARLLFGAYGENLRVFEEKIGVNLHIRGNEVLLDGPPEAREQAEAVLKKIYDLLRKDVALYPNDVAHAIEIMLANPGIDLEEIFADTILVSSRNRSITPKSVHQKAYIDAIRTCDIVFGIGPAGTGKTYLAMAMAIASLYGKEVDRIVLARPAVEAGERLGFLPGDLIEKVNPYLRPLYDALHDMMSFEKTSHLIKQGVIEVAPIAFMRGRTLNDAFVILDEAQNATSEQMKMFLTRLGFNSKAVITGDVTQIDLEKGKISGLIEAEEILSGIPGIAFCYFTERDVVRHPLVQKIILAYEGKGRGRPARGTGREGGAEGEAPEGGFEG